MFKLNLNKENATEEEMLIFKTFNNLYDFMSYEAGIITNPKGYLLIETLNELRDWIKNHKWEKYPLNPDRTLKEIDK